VVSFENRSYSLRGIERRSPKTDKRMRIFPVMARGSGKVYDLLVSC
jgi:hypothetical protein